MTTNVSDETLLKNTDATKISVEENAKEAVLNTDFYSGTVKWFNSKGGYGFISSNENGEDIFVHHTAIDTSNFKYLRQGEQVEYRLIPAADTSQHKYQAWDIRGANGNKLICQANQKNFSSIGQRKRRVFRDHPNENRTEGEPYSYRKSASTTNSSSSSSRPYSGVYKHRGQPSSYNEEEYIRKIRDGNKHPFLVTCYEADIQFM